MSNTNYSWTCKVCGLTISATSFIITEVANHYKVNRELSKPQSHCDLILANQPKERDEQVGATTIELDLQTFNLLSTMRKASEACDWFDPEDWGPETDSTIKLDKVIFVRAQTSEHNK